MMMKILSKFYFIATLAMFFFIALMVVENDISARALLLVPIVICYSVAWILFSMDRADMVQDIIEHQKKRLQK